MAARNLAFECAEWQSTLWCRIRRPQYQPLANCHPPGQRTERQLRAEAAARRHADFCRTIIASTL